MGVLRKVADVTFDVLRRTLASPYFKRWLLVVSVVYLFVALQLFCNAMSLAFGGSNYFRDLEHSSHPPSLVLAIVLHAAVGLACFYFSGHRSFGLRAVGCFATLCCIALIYPPITPLIYLSAVSLGIAFALTGWSPATVLRSRKG